MNLSIAKNEENQSRNDVSGSTYPEDVLPLVNCTLEKFEFRKAIEVKIIYFLTLSAVKCATIRGEMKPLVVPTKLMIP